MKNIVLFGSGGFGAGYVKLLLDPAFGEELPDARLVGVVDPFAAFGANYPLLVSHSIPIFKNAEDFFAASSADVAIIATPIMHHRRHAEAALAHGCDVLLEKPVAGSSEDGYAIEKAAQTAGHKVTVGFQWTTDPVMQAFKSDVDAGRFGKLLWGKALVLWYRNAAYFSRGGGWAGKQYDADGTAIFDSVATNATAHYLYNMLWIAARGNGAVAPEDVSFLAARANPVETYDSIALRGKTEEGASLLFLASHAIAPEESHDPIFTYHFQNGVACYGHDAHRPNHLIFRFLSGEVVDYGDSYRDGWYRKTRCSLDYFDGRGDNYCPVSSACRHLETLENLWKGQTQMPFFPEKKIVRTPDGVWVRGLADSMYAAYDENRLPEREEWGL